MEKLKLQTQNGVTANIQRISELFPNCVTETLDANGRIKLAVDFDKLRQELSNEVAEGKDERYEFVWPDKKKAILLANAPINATLRPCKEESVNFDKTENLYIEGDNLDVLKCLKETYLGKVKMIYIDPPYNTGNDFVYNDDFAENASEYLENSGQYDDQGNRLTANLESNGRFHTDWLNMIYPRLKVARDLLSKDGVIFISIDDNEAENLKKLCEEIFGKNNYIAQLVWEKKKKGSFLSNSITNIKEYVIVFCKNRNEFNGLIGEINNSIETYPCVNAVNKRELRIIPKGIESKYKIKNYILPKGSEISDTTMNLILHSDLVIENGYLKEDLIIEGNWRYSQAAMKDYAENHELYITRDLYLRRIVSDARFKTLKDLLPRVGDNPDLQYNSPININNLFESGWGSNEDADEELRKIFNVQKLMDYPKPMRLILKLLASYRFNDAIILDFFSGSGTTAHAVMQLNAEDGGNRKFIMVQLPEPTDEKSVAYKSGYKNICEIGKERIRRAAKKIKEETGADIDYGFRVLKLDSSNMQDVFYSPAELKQDQLDLFADNIKPDRTGEDLLFQVMLELGATLDSKIEKKVINGKDVFVVSDGYIVACFDKEVNDDVVKTIAQMQPQYAVLRDGSLADDSTATNFEQIFKTYSSGTICKII